MRVELERGWGLKAGATVYYDRPPDFFRPASLEVRLQQLDMLCHSIRRQSKGVLWKLEAQQK